MAITNCGLGSPGWIDTYNLAVGPARATSESETETETKTRLQWLAIKIALI